MSATHSRLGAMAEKPRPTRSAGCLAAGAGTVVRGAGQAHLAHEPFHSAAAYLGALPGELAPDLAGTVDAEVGLKDPGDLRLQLSVTPGLAARRPLFG
jgi:hypothetical protein